MNITISINIQNLLLCNNVVGSAIGCKSFMTFSEITTENDFRIHQSRWRSASIKTQFIVYVNFKVKSWSTTQVEDNIFIGDNTKILMTVGKQSIFMNIKLCRYLGECALLIELYERGSGFEAI